MGKGKLGAFIGGAIVAVLIGCGLVVYFVDPFNWLGKNTIPNGTYEMTQSVYDGKTYTAGDDINAYIASLELSDPTIGNEIGASIAIYSILSLEIDGKKLDGHIFFGEGASGNQDLTAEYSRKGETITITGDDATKLNAMGTFTYKDVKLTLTVTGANDFQMTFVFEKGN